MLKKSDEVKALQIIGIEILKDKNAVISEKESSDQEEKFKSLSDNYLEYLKIFQNLKKPDTN